MSKRKASLEQLPEGAEAAEGPARGKLTQCLACGRRLRSLGRMKVLTGIRPEIRGLMMDPLLAQQQQAVPLEMFVCDGCGKVEFYDASDRSAERG